MPSMIYLPVEWETEANSDLRIWPVVEARAEEAEKRHQPSGREAKRSKIGESRWSENLT